MATPAPVLDYEIDAVVSAAVSDSVASRQRYAVPAIPYHNTLFRLSEPVVIALYPENGIWICECEAIKSLVHGNTLGEAIETFCEDFAVLWDEIANAPDDNLAPDAQRLKAIVRSLVRAVEKVG